MKVMILISIFILSACSSQYTNQLPLNKNFPNVSGESLSGKVWDIPKEMSGRKVLFLIGYKQDSQFDIDRWLIGLDMTNTKVEVYELPTIKGMFPRMFKQKINTGMKRGIPQMLWKSVITIYKDGEKVQKFTGNENPNNTRVILLNPKGRIIYFYDKGFSVYALNNLREIINE